MNSRKRYMLHAENDANQISKLSASCFETVQYFHKDSVCSSIRGSNTNDNEKTTPAPSMHRT